MSEPVRAPSRRLFLREQLAAAEFGAFLASSPFLRRVGRGDRHPVLVLPGFTGSDRSTAPLRSFLRSQGYWVHGWNLGPNLGPTRSTVEGIRRRLLELHARHGVEVSLVGWSLGGIYAREMARRDPDAVRQVITLGSPFRFRDGDRSNASFLADRWSHRFVPLSDEADLPEDQRAPLPVPSTAIYTRTDGVVRWYSCIQSEGPGCENVEVRGSHNGLGHNPSVLFVIGDRLAQREGQWVPFRPPPGLRRLYPKPVWYRSGPLTVA